MRLESRRRLLNLTLYLMRHGQTAPETPWRFLGQRDAALSGAGRAQAAAWRDTLRDVDFAGAWCSDLARCRDTAGIVLEGRDLTATPVPGLREISLGEWDGLTVAEVKSRYPGLYEARGANIAEFRPPGGESFSDLAERAWTFLTDEIFSFRSPKQVANLLVLAHAGVNRVLLCKLLGMSLSRVFSLGQDPCCLNIVSFGPGGPYLTLLNGQPKL